MTMTTTMMMTMTMSTMMFMVTMMTASTVVTFVTMIKHREPDDHGHDNHDDHLDHLHLDYDDYLEDDDHLDHNELMTIKFVRKLEVVHKDVGGCPISYNLFYLLLLSSPTCLCKEGYLTRCALPRRSLKLIIIKSLSQSVRYVGMELLG